MQREKQKAQEVLLRFLSREYTWPRACDLVTTKKAWQIVVAPLKPSSQILSRCLRPPLLLRGTATLSKHHPLLLASQVSLNVHLTAVHVEALTMVGTANRVEKTTMWGIYLCRLTYDSRLIVRSTTEKKRFPPNDSLFSYLEELAKRPFNGNEFCNCRIICQRRTFVW